MAQQIYLDEHGKYLAVDPATARLRLRPLAFVIGILAIALAGGLHLIDNYYGVGCQRDSISHYYYEPRAGIFLVMALSVVATFLFAYRGETIWDSRLANVAGIAALLVAFFPADGVGCQSSESDSGLVDLRPGLIVEVPQAPPGTFKQFHDLVPARVDGDVPAGKVTVELASKTSATIHDVAAAALFVVLLYFSAYAFPRKNATSDLDGRRFTLAKRARNTIYYLSSAVMVAAAVLILVRDLLPFVDVDRPVYWGEAVFLAAFGVSWLVKSRGLWGYLYPSR